MHGAMSGFYEVRVKLGQTNYRLFCILERQADDLGGPSLICIGGLQKPVREAAKPKDYSKVIKWRDEFKARRTVL